MTYFTKKTVKFDKILPFLILLIVISRIPFLSLGFGYDIDGWVVVNTAYFFNQTGQYIVSRGLGHPLFEFLIAGLLRLNSSEIIPDWILTNSIVLISFLLSVILFYKILKAWKIENPYLLIFTYSFMPVLWRNSTMTDDFLISLMFILLAQYLLINNRFIYSSIALSFACGTRFENSIIILPFILLLWLITKNRRLIISYLLIWGIIIAIFLMPYIANYGTFTYEQYKEVGELKSNFMMYFLKAGYRGIYWFLGIDAAIFLIGGLLLKRLQIKKLSDKILALNPEYIFSFSTVLVFILLFIKFPYKQEYLLPMIPSLFILLNFILGKKNFLIFSLICILNGFIMIPGVEVKFSPEGKIYSEIHAVAKGTLIDDINKRLDLMKAKSFLNENSFPPNSIILWHRYQIAYAYFIRDKILDEGYVVKKGKLLHLDGYYDRKHNIFFINLGRLYFGNAEAFRKTLETHKIYYLPCTVSHIYSEEGIDIMKYNPELIKNIAPNEY